MAHYQSYFIYCAGFMFRPDGERVALVRKNRPAWQHGKLNAVGGKIEQGETPEQAMAREFKEETGVEHNDWRRYAVISGPGWRVYFFATKSDKIDAVQTMTDETIEVHTVQYVLDFGSIIENLKWLVPLALYENVDIVRAVYKK